MPLTEAFHHTSAGKPETAPSKGRRKRPAPFSLRLSEEERARLMAEAKGAPLGAYIKAKLAGMALPVQMRRTGLAVEDRQALAKVLALLGGSRLSSNLNQLAHAANIGALPMTPETEEHLRAAVDAVADMRRLLLAALGLRPEGGP